MVSETELTHLIFVDLEPFFVFMFQLLCCAGKSCFRVVPELPLDLSEILNDVVFLVN